MKAFGLISTLIPLVQTDILVFQALLLGRLQPQIVVLLSVHVMFRRRRERRRKLECKIAKALEARRRVCFWRESAGAGKFGKGRLWHIGPEPGHEATAVTLVVAYLAGVVEPFAVLGRWAGLFGHLVAVAAGVEVFCDGTHGGDEIRRRRRGRRLVALGDRGRFWLESLGLDVLIVSVRLRRLRKSGHGR